jgi:long-chain acyl-CoA synthetase
LTLHEAIIRSARAHPNRKAFNYLKDGRWASITYGEFIRMAQGAQECLRGQGVSRGGHVAIISENRPEWCAFYLGTLMMGAVAVPIDVRLTPPEIRNILEHSGASALVFSSGSETTVKAAASDLDVKNINIDSVILAAAGDLSYEDASDDDVASLLYTSGTTGTPKGVMLTHRNLCSDVEAVEAVGLMGAEENVLSALPLHHTYPFMCTFALPLSLGVSVTFPAGLKGPDLLDAVTSTGVTVLVAVPRMLELMRDRIYSRFEEMRGAPGRGTRFAVRVLSGLRGRFGINLAKHMFARRFGGQFRFFACGGARLEPQIMRDMEALGFTVVEGYGLTETSPIVAFNPIDRRKPGSVGRAVKGAEIRIANPDEKGTGEVAVRGPMVMMGYYKNPEATEAAVREGWFYTGDLGYLDDEGYLFITGRAKEVIVLGSGKNIYPEDVEKLYAGIPLIKELCVLPVGDRLHAVIVPDAEQRVKGDFEDALRTSIKELSENIASHMRISGYTVSDRPLPRTPLGKLRRFMVADIVKGKRREKEEDPSLADGMSQRVLACLTRLAEEPGPYRSTDDLELDLGLDSLRRLEMVSALEVEFSVKLPESLANDVRTVAELVEALKKGEAAGEGQAEGSMWGEPSPEEKKRAGLMRHAWEWPISALSALILRLLFRMLFRLEVAGVEKIPPPPFIIAPNHLSNVDGLVVASAVPLGVFRRLYFQGYYKYFEGSLKSLFARLSHVISIDPMGRLRNAMRLSAHVLGRGDGLCIFPEGQRSFDGETGVFKKGIGILARHGDVPVVPARIEGTFEALPRGTVLPRPQKVRITFGDALRPSDLDYSGRPEGVEDEQYFADVLRERVTGL